MDLGSDVEATQIDVPIACTLSTKDGAAQVREWGDLRRFALDVTALPTGVRMTLPATLVDDVEDLARREAACCAFLTITTSVANDVVTLEIVSENPDALPVISVLAGVELI